MIFNYYEAEITKSEPLGEITLDKLLSAIKYPKKKISDVFKKIRQAEEAGDMAAKNKLKTKLYSFTPAVYVKESRKYENIKSWTGLMPIDFDHLPSIEYSKELKKELFKKYKFIIASWLSPSRHGVRAFIKIPICYSVDEFKEYFNAIEIEFSIIRGFDKALKNCILPMFLSYDPELLQRNDYTEWNKKYIPPPPPPPIKQYVINDRSNKIERIIASMINKIDSNGHPQLRAAAYLLGGYVGAGQIDDSYALQIIEKMIDCNAYLSQKASVYKKTAKTMIDKGERQPLYLK